MTKTPPPTEVSGGARPWQAGCADVITHFGELSARPSAESMPVIILCGCRHLATGGPI